MLALAKPDGLECCGGSFCCCCCCCCCCRCGSGGGRGMKPSMTPYGASVPRLSPHPLSALPEASNTVRCPCGGRRGGGDTGSCGGGTGCGNGATGSLAPPPPSGTSELVRIGRLCLLPARGSPLRLGWSMHLPVEVIGLYYSRPRGLPPALTLSLCDTATLVHTYIYACTQTTLHTMPHVTRRGNPHGANPPPLGAHVMRTAVSARCDRPRDRPTIRTQQTDSGVHATMPSRIAVHSATAVPRTHYILRRTLSTDRRRGVPHPDRTTNH